MAKRLQELFMLRGSVSSTISSRSREMTARMFESCLLRHWKQSVVSMLMMNVEILGTSSRTMADLDISSYCIKTVAMKIGQNLQVETLFH